MYPLMKNLILILILSLYSTDLYSGSEKTSFRFEDAHGNEFSILRLQPEQPSDLLAVWFVDHDEQRPRFDSMLDALAGAGIEVWRVDLLNDLFLPRGNESARALPGAPVTSVIEAALARHDGPILLVSYDRMALPVLRGLRLWQASARRSNRLLGAALFYPNLFGPAPAAGEAAALDPIVNASNYPLVVFQPELGSHRWRIAQVMDALWRNEAPALFFRLPGIRDWFFMDEEGTDRPADQATLAMVKKMPELLRQAATLLAGYKPPSVVLPLETATTHIAAEAGPAPVAPPRRAPVLELPRYPKTQSAVVDFTNKVTVVVFWATWCPPCVEEMPSLNRLRQHFDQRPFQIVSVDFQESADVIRQFLQKVPVDFPILLDLDGTTSARWRVFSFPSTFVIDGNGNIRYSVNHAIDWNTPEIQQLIEQLLQQR
jgi:thiol-disulfide isomerase/thioredoxin